MYIDIPPSTGLMEFLHAGSCWYVRIHQLRSTFIILASRAHRQGLQNLCGRHRRKPGAVQQRCCRSCLAMIVTSLNSRNWSFDVMRPSPLPAASHGLPCLGRIGKLLECIQASEQEILSRTQQLAMLQACHNRSHLLYGDLT